MDSFEAKQKEAQETQILYATEKQKQENIELEILKFEAKLAKLRGDIENVKKEKQENLARQELLAFQVNNINQENNELNAVIDEFSNVNKENQKYIDD